ncbi:hypothetical protein Pdw03_6645 [Penicillium digitatum]|uniref:Ell binding protein Ebp1 C-terminal domain-containing protein n=3 Tax=Penicillium digitatum TaxID=36651 RepID=K9GH61_PEND2|nr:hypothetical protein PDIP_34480 [Penicillium digitatum Pd1]EKV12571.1 hypothetical protein PDIG_43250 [Penicillium digitatum PHI26]EKV16661.1 hypothetical protein PDIP_34480 [Penicillium digitatum Pd1]KAG0157973.1 hypothetical protein PDIDSM_5485 [Penicillium digitatum]QQK42744.1 hypothetical protein Pdw03_6645 [Penicillium digitatum]
MSVNEKRNFQPITTPRAATSPTSDREVLDQRLQRLSDDVLPPVPYLLTFPTKTPFNLGTRSANNWAVGHDRPFSLEEQQLQYMTFLTHHDTDSLLLAVGDWSDETGRMMTDRSTAPSTVESSRETVSKKKISLKDYKTQKTSAAVASPVGLEAGSRGASNSAKSEERRQMTSSEPLNISDKTKMSRMPPKSHARLSPERAGQKRPSGSELEFPHPSVTKKSEAHPTKKLRLCPEKDTRREPSPVKSYSPKLPALLSPTLPPTSGGPRLPRLLSPTLPPDIEKELARLEDRPPSRNSRAGKGLPAKESNTQEYTRDHARVDTQKTQLLTKLRYGRANRKRVEALLKFSGKKKAHLSDSPVSQDTDRDDVFHSRKKGGDTGLFRGYTSGDPKGRKNETGEAIGPQYGRSKEPKSYPEKPRTPVAQTHLTSHSTTSDKTKAASITPVKDLKDQKPFTSRRNEPGETDSKAPSNPANKRHSVDPGSTMKASPTQVDGRTRNERQVWWDEWQKFASIGRELKHAAERHTSKTGISVTDEKLAVVTAIEALLSFIMAFVANDQAKASSRQVGDSSTWLSIVPYWRVVRKNSVPYPALNSLCLLLGAVSFTAIHTLDLERLAISPIPGEHTPVPTPGSDGNAALSDENRKSKKEFSELKVRLPECYKESQRLWIEGTRGLSEDILGREFPTIWSQRSRNYSERGRSSLKAGEYAGSYFLPLGGTTPPIEVVRFGWFLLKEWCSKERVEWNGRLGL